MKRAFTLLALVLVATLATAQLPQTMSYQAVIRNTSSELVVSTQIGMRISILQGTPDGTAVYTETLTPTTNANGLVSVEIGGEEGFADIDWAAGPYFIKTETDPQGGTDYTITGTSQLLTVPYALYAKSAETIAGGITEADPQFTSSAAAGITATDIDNLGNLSGVNTGDQDLSGYATTATLSESIQWEKTDTSIFYNNGNVGIGTNIPSSKLTIQTDGSFYSSYAGLHIKETTDRGTFNLESVADAPTDFIMKNNNRYSWSISSRNSAADYALHFYSSTSGTSFSNMVMGLTPEGNVGIGTATPAAKLDIKTSADSAVILRLNTDRPWQFEQIGTEASTRLHFRSLAGSKRFNITDYTHGIVASFFAGGEGIGGVGIGREGSELYKLDVEGEITSRSPNAFRLRSSTYSAFFRNDGNSLWCLLTDTIDVDGHWNSLRPFRVWLKTGDVSLGNHSVFVQHGGNVGIGTTSPTAKLTIKAASTSTENDALFAVKNKAGNEVFTVYPNSIKVSVAEPVNAQDIVTKAYVDELKNIIYEEMLEAGLNGIVKDIQGNIYKTIKIGSQVWMAENLKATKYKNGSNIPLVIDNSQWSNLTTSGYCWYNNDQSSFGSTYGVLYNWFAVSTGNLCPMGWHIPTNLEWEELIEFLGGASIAGGKLKDAGTEYWLDPNEGATNVSGFTGLPGGCRNGLGGSYGSIFSSGFFWSSDYYDSQKAINYYLYKDGSNTTKGFYEKKWGFSVRCVKD